MKLPLVLLATLTAAACSTAPTDSGPDPAPAEPELPQTTLACATEGQDHRILIDASRDGGVWWYPQGDYFDPAAPHQGKQLADYIRSRGYVVDELGRGRIVSDTLLATYAGVIRAGQYGTYTIGELRAYSWFIDCGMTVLLLGELLREGGHDILAESIGITAVGNLSGMVTTFAEHPITRGAGPLPFNAGSGFSGATDVVGVLGRLDTGEAVMGIVGHPKARIFFLGDTNGLEEVPQPLVDNLISWGFE